MMIYKRLVRSVNRKLAKNTTFLEPRPNNPRPNNPQPNDQEPEKQKNQINILQATRNFSKNFRKFRNESRISGI
jgi:hypothetical protein